MRAGTGNVVTGKWGAPRARPETISRRRVRERLEQLAHAHVVLVCAPAGSGKTTALAEWHETLSSPAVWLTLRAEDNDPRRLFARLIAALDQLWTGALWPAQRAASGGSDLATTVVPLIAEAVDREIADERLVIVLDDYHRVEASASARLLATLLNALPDSVQLVLGSRSRPRGGLARDRAERVVGSIGAADLAFTDAEAAQFFDGALRLRLGAERTRAINEHVEGWAAGISLFASALREDREADGLIPALPRSREMVAEYLLDEVLANVSPRMRAFLSSTSILDRMCPSLCEAVSHDPQARELLAQARQTNLFVVSLNAEEDGAEWTRYHRLFADLLERDFAASAPAAHTEAHRRAARWFSDAGMAQEAIAHASAAGDGPLAARLLHEHHWPLIAARRYATIERLLQRMPAQRGELGPFCELVGIFCTALQGTDLRRVAERLDALEADREAPYVADLLDTMRISPFYGDIPRAAADGWRCWEAARADPARRARMAGQFATVLWFAGDHAAVQTKVAAHMGQIDRPALRSWELAALSLCAAESGELAAAERHARLALATITSSGAESAPEALWSYVALAEALRLSGRLDEASAQVLAALRTTTAAPGSMYEALALVFQAQVDLSSRNRLAARRRAAAARRIVDAHVDAAALDKRLAAIEAALAEPTTAAIADSEPTAAELRVLVLLPSGLSRDEIAARLGLSPSTVKSHMWRLFQRLSVRSREEAVEVARERGLLQRTART
jgi:LuxR family maltose regulon positive regulatory protein